LVVLVALALLAPLKETVKKKRSCAYIVYGMVLGLYPIIVYLMSSIKHYKYAFLRLPIENTKSPKGLLQTGLM